MMEYKKRVTQSDRKINQKNKKLMIDKILSYNPMLIEGIEVYKDANRNFIALIVLGALLIKFTLVSGLCCLLSMFYIIRMLQFIRYKSIYIIVNNLARDISYRGIYDKGKAHEMLNDFRVKYGENIIEYYELENMLEKYEVFVTKIKYVLRNIKMNEKIFLYNKERFSKNIESLESKDKERLSFEETSGKQHDDLKKSNCYAKDFKYTINYLF